MILSVQTLLAILYVAIAGLYIFRVAKALRTGVVWSPIGFVSRKEQAAGYWIMIVSGGVAIAVVGIMGTTTATLLAAFSPP